MFRKLFYVYFLVAFLSLPMFALAQEKPELPPTPTEVRFVVGTRVSGDGTRKSPYVFTVGMKGDIRIATEKPIVATWMTDDAPEDNELIESTSRLLFPTEVLGSYSTVAYWKDVDQAKALRCWFVIKSGNSPPVPQPDPDQPTEADRIVALAKDAFVGPTAKSDAKLYQAAIDAVVQTMNDPVKSAKLINISDVQAAYGAALTAVGWKPGVYPKLSALVGELFDRDSNLTKPMDAATRTTFLSNFQALSKACQEISK